MRNSFDLAAKNYDQLFTNSNIGKLQRNLVHQHIITFLKKDKKLNILEINCGTGEDAIWFAKQGHQVLATDISKTMIDVAKNKVDLDNLYFKPFDINHIGQLKPDEKYDLIFSNFGGLNCLSTKELSQFYVDSLKLLKDNGRVINVMMPKCCIWDNIYLLYKIRWKSLFRRNTNKGVTVKVNGLNVQTWYYNPKEIISLTKGLFDTESTYPVGLFIPPSFLESFFSKKRRILQLLAWLDSRFKLSILSKYADHFIITLKAK